MTPHLVIAGAPKCGTTSIFHWLSLHPDVCPSSEKETYFLLDKGYPLYRKGQSIHNNGIEGYGRFFAHCIGEGQLRLEATPDYLYQTTALEFFSSLNTPPEILFVLRKPSERVYSLYQFARNNLSVLPKRVCFRDFVEGLSASDRPSFLRDRHILQQAIKHSQYVDYIEVWLEKLRGHIHVALFEDMTNDPRKFMIQLAGQLGLDAAFFSDHVYSGRNKTYAVKSQSLHKLKRNFSTSLPLGKYRQLLLGVYSKLNTQEALRKTPDDYRVIELLDQHFESYNKQLEELLALDLSEWRKT